jgi:FKBP-type peptidyl-prolyl cis-trans isomerase FklB
MNKLLLSAGLIGLLASHSVMAETTTTTQTASTNKSDAQQVTSGEAFLEKNKKMPGVTTLPDGLQYKVLTEGKGVKPKAQDTVTVHYEGKLVNGTEFDSSYKRGEPTTFPVSGVIAGWTEALLRMPVGSTWELYIPAALAYGEVGAPPIIGPNEVLIFKVNLIGIKKA